MEFVDRQGTEEHIREAEAWSAHNYKPLPVVLSHGEGVWVWDVDGQRYLDMLSAYSALNQGHRHPAILQALEEQAGRITLTSRAFHNDRMGPFLRELCELVGYDRALPMNTGVEAVETAIKMVRRWGYRTKGVPADQAEIVVCDGNFHGRTTTVVGFSSSAEARDDFGPFPEGFRTVPYGDASALREAIGPNTVGFLVEPIQGEGGVRVPPDGYLREAREICASEGVALIADEIQTGLGRTGSLLASSHEGVRPDVVTLGKALGGGVYPVSAVLADNELMEVFEPGSHGSTFGGNPLASAVGQASLRVIREEGLAERARRLGDRMMETIRSFDSPHVEEVRGRGLLVGVVIRESSGAARGFCERLQARGLLAKETQKQVIRFAPPLVIEEEVLDEALESIGEVLAG